MGMKSVAALAKMTEEVTSSKIEELTALEIDAVAGGLLSMSREQNSAVASA